MPVVQVRGYGPIRFPDNMPEAEIRRRVEYAEAQAPQIEFDPRDLSTTQKITGGAKRTLSGLGSLVTDVAPALFGSAFGFEDYAREQMAEAKAKREAAERESPTAFRSYKDIRGVGDVPGFVAETLGEGAVDLASLLVPGGVGSVVGRRIAQRGAAEAGEQIAKRLASREAAMAAGPQDVRALAETATRRLAPTAAREGAETGFKTGVRGGAYGLASGEIFQSVEEETGKLEPVLALTLGVPFAALDSFLPEQIAKQLGSTGKALLTKEMLEQSTLPAAKSMASRLAVSIPSLAAKEGLTESAQESISILAEQIAGSKKEFFDPENVDRMITSGLKGGIAGGVFGAPGAAVEAARGKRADQAQIDAEIARRLEAAKTPEEREQILMLGYDASVKKSYAQGEFQPVVFPDGTLAFTQQEVDDYRKRLEEQELEEKYGRRKEEPRALGEALPVPRFEGRVEQEEPPTPAAPLQLPKPEFKQFSPIITEDGTVLFTPRDVALYELSKKQTAAADEERQFQEKYAPQRLGQRELFPETPGGRTEATPIPEITSIPITQSFLAEAGVGRGSAPYKQFVGRDLADPDTMSEFRAFLRERAENPSRSQAAQDKAKAADAMLSSLPLTDQQSLYLPIEMGTPPVEPKRAERTGQREQAPITEGELTPLQQEFFTTQLAKQRADDIEARMQAGESVTPAEQFFLRSYKQELKRRAAEGEKRDVELEGIPKEPEGRRDVELAVEPSRARDRTGQLTIPDLEMVPPGSQAQPSETVTEEPVTTKDKRQMEMFTPTGKPSKAAKVTTKGAQDVTEPTVTTSGESVPVSGRPDRGVPTGRAEPSVDARVERAEPATDQPVRGEKPAQGAVKEEQKAPEKTEEKQPEEKTKPKKETPSAVTPTETQQAKEEGAAKTTERKKVAEPATGEPTEDRTLQGQLSKVKTERGQKRTEAEKELGVFLKTIEDGFLAYEPKEVGTENDQERVRLIRRNATTETGTAARIYFNKMKRLVDGLYMMAWDIANNTPRARSVEDTHPIESEFLKGMNAENAKLAVQWVRNNLSDTVRRKLADQMLSTRRAAATSDKFVKLLSDALDAERVAQSKAKGKADVTNAEIDDVLAQMERAKNRIESLSKVKVSGLKPLGVSGGFVATPTDSDSANYFLNSDAVSPLTKPLHPAMEGALRSGDLPTALRLMAVQGEMIGKIANALLAGNLKTKVKVVDGLKENGRPAAGYYDPKTDTIYLDSEIGLNNHVALHEAVHAATSHILANKSHPVTKQLQSLFDAVKDQLGDAYGTQSLDEFVAEAFSNPDFQAQLAAIRINVKDGRPVSAWSRFVNTITNFVRRLMGMEARPFEVKSAMDVADELISQIISPAPASRDGARLMMQATTNPNFFIKYLDSLTEKAVARGPNTTLSKIAIAVNEFLSGTLPKFARSTILSSLPLEAFVEVAEKYLPGVKKLDLLLDQRSGYEFKMLKNTEPLIAAAEKWSKKNGEVMTKLFNKVIYGSTLARVDPTKPRDTYKGDAEALKAWDTLNKAFNKLDPEGKQLYMQMRDTYGRLYKELLDSIEDRINTLISDKARAESIKKDIWAKITARGGIDPYFPLTRKGAYWLSYADAKGEHYVSAYENRFERNKAIEALGKKGFKEFEEFSNLDQFKVFSRAPSTSFINGVIKTLEINRPTKGDAESLKRYKDAEEEIVRLFLNSLPETAFAQSFQAREDRLGFDEDAIGALRTKSFSLARQIANMRYGAKMQDLLAKMAESVKSERGKAEDPEKTALAQEYLEELGKRVKVITDPQVSDWSRLLTSFGFNMTLGLNLSSAIINLSQVPLVVLPILGGKYGYDQARQAIQRAYTTYAKTGFNTEREVDYIDENGKPVKAKYKMKAMPNLGNLNFDDPNTPAELKHLKTLAEMASDRGMLNSSQLYDTLEANEGTSVSGKVNAVTGAMFHHGERMNRQVSMIAAYELELARLKKEGRTGKAAEEEAANYAIYTTKLTNGGTSAGAAPRIAQGNIGRVVFMFKRYGVSMYYMLFKTANELLKHEDKNVRDQAKMQIAGLYGMAALFAGVQGLPFFGLAAMVYAATLADDDDKDDTLEIQTRKYMGELAYKGAFNYIFNVDVAARMGFNDLIVRDVLNEQDKTLLVRAAEMLGGPVVGSVSKLERGYNLMKEGEMYRGVEAMLPTSLGNMMKATRFLSEGTAKTVRGDPIVDDVSAGNVLGQFFGFAPADLTKQLEINAREKGIDRRVSEEKTNNLRKYYVASRVGDADGMQEAKEELKKLGDKHKGLFPDGLNKTIQRSMAQHAKSTERMYHGVLFSRALEDELRKDAAELED
jgi:hypothetical protein